MSRQKMPPFAGTDTAASKPSKVLAVTARPKPPNAGKGRKKGVPNKVTADTREAIRQLLEQAAPLMGGWLERVAKDDPARALDLVLKAAEYAIPKLSRAEIKTNSGDLATALKEAGERVRAHEQEQREKDEQRIQEEVVRRLNSGQRTGLAHVNNARPSEPAHTAAPALSAQEIEPPPRLTFDVDPGSDQNPYRPF